MKGKNHNDCNETNKKNVSKGIDMSEYMRRWMKVDDKWLNSNNVS